MAALLNQPCDFDAVVSGAKCFECLAPNQLLAIQAYIYWQDWKALDPEAPQTLDALLAASRDLVRLTQKQQLAIIALILCQLNSLSQPT